MNLVVFNEWWLLSPDIKADMDNLTLFGNYIDTHKLPKYFCFGNIQVLININVSRCIFQAGRCFYF